MTSLPYSGVPRARNGDVRIRNFIERTFGETRRRTKVIGRLPGETSAARTAPPAPATNRHRDPGRRAYRQRQCHRLTSLSTGTAPVPYLFYSTQAPAGRRDGSGVVVGRISFTSPANRDEPKVLWWNDGAMFPCCACE